MSRDRLDRFVTELRDNIERLIDHDADPGEPMCMALRGIVGAIELAYISVSKGPEGTRVVIGPGHTSRGQTGTVVMAEMVYNTLCYRVHLDNERYVIVPQDMCLPVDTPPPPGTPVETVTALYARHRAAAAQET
jgi:hypothetical protein